MASNTGRTGVPRADSAPSIPWRTPLRPAATLFGEALIDEFASLRVVGGAPFNVACALAQFDCAPLLISAIGADASGELVKAALRHFGIGSTGVQRSPALPTGRVVVEQNGVAHRFTILPDQAYDAIESPAALTAMRNAPPRILYFGTLAQRHATSWQTLQKLLAATSARRFLDVNLRDGQVERTIVLGAMEQADIVKVNREELQILATWAFGSDADAAHNLDQVTERFMQAFSLSEMIVTDGAQGWRHTSRDGSVVSGAALSVAKVVDTVGAGDAFSAIYLVGQLHHWPLSLTLQRAGEFAAAICQRRGAVVDDLRFYAGWYGEWFGGRRAIDSPSSDSPSQPGARS